MNIEGRRDSERLDYVYDNYMEPYGRPDRPGPGSPGDRRADPAGPRPDADFLVTHGAAAPFSLVPLARRFDPSDPLDPAAVEAHADLVVDILIAGLQLR